MESRTSRFLKRVRDTQPAEIDCSTCLEQISRYVDLEISAGQAAQLMPQVSQHLGQCTVCHEEYQVLLDLGRMEQDGSAPSNPDLLDRLKKARGSAD